MIEFKHRSSLQRLSVIVGRIQTVSEERWSDKRYLNQHTLQIIKCNWKSYRERSKQHNEIN